MTEVITVTATHPGGYGLRIRCDTCGGWTEKFEPHWTVMLDVPGGSDEIIVCWRCVEKGEVAEGLTSQAERLEAHAAWCRMMAKREWRLPTVSDLEAEGRKQDAMFDEVGV